MTEPDFQVPARSWNDIDELALSLRTQLGLRDTPRFEVIDVVERVLDQELGLVSLQVDSDSDMDGALGYTDPEGKFIRLSLSTYEAACEGDGRARFTVAHELGHWMMHTGLSAPLPRLSRPQSVKPYMRAEPQANRYAASLLMPEHLIVPTDNEMLMVMKFGVSFEAASHRLDGLNTVRNRKGSSM